MHITLCRSTDYQRALARAELRAPVNLTRMWTGRARISTATNTAIPRCVASTTHRTRVSEKRLLPSIPPSAGDPRKPRHLSG